jgi:hypothetical protein
VLGFCQGVKRRRRNRRQLTIDRFTWAVACCLLGFLEGGGERRREEKERPKKRRSGSLFGENWKGAVGVPCATAYCLPQGAKVAQKRVLT